MTDGSTTIRVSLAQRVRLRQLARERATTMTDVLDAALLALGREQFYRSMADAESELRTDPAAWADYISERDAWLGAGQ